MTKEEKEAKKKKLAAQLAKLDSDDDAGDDDAGEEDPREAKITDLIAKGVDKAIERRIKGGGQPPKRAEKGFLDTVAEIFGVKE